MNRFAHLTFVVIAMLSLSAATLAQTPTSMIPGGGATGYIAIDLGPQMWAAAINNNGEIILHDQNQQTFVSWIGGTRRILLPPAGSTGYGNRINDSGFVVGNINSLNPTQWYGAAWNSDGNCTTFNSVKYLADINTSGIAVGVTEGGGVRVVDINSGAWKNITGFGFPTAINDAGTVCGTSGNDPCTWTSNGRITILPRPSGFLTGGWATDLNNNDVVVGGFWSASTGDRAVVWQNGVCRILATFGRGETLASAVNSSNVVVGYAYDPATCRQHPVIWSNYQIAKLPLLPGSRGGCTYSLNDYGWVVGMCYTYSGIPHATLWLPSTGSTNSFQQ